MLEKLKPYRYKISLFFNAIFITFFVLSKLNDSASDPQEESQDLINDVVATSTTPRVVPSFPLGIDVSHHQGRINWREVKQDGVRFAFVRVSEGITLDERFVENWRGAKNAGIIRGAYQFFRPRHSGSLQADLFIQHVGRRRNGDLPAVLDVEADDNISKETVIARIREWLQRYRDVTGYDTVIIYTGHFWNELSSPKMPGTHLWIAHYTTRPNPRLPNNNRWPTWKFWQYSATGRIRGINGPVDMNVFNGDTRNLIYYARNL